MLATVLGDLALDGSRSRVTKPISTLMTETDAHLRSLNAQRAYGALRVKASTALIADIWCEKIRGCSYRGGNRFS